MKFTIPTQLKIVLVMIAVFSFAISYNNLHAMALEMGIPYYLAWFFPLCIDLFLIACSIFILYAEEKCQNESKEGWIFLISYTILSIWYNVLHSPPEFWYQVGFAICPVSLCVSLHLFIKVIKHEMGGCPVPVAPPEVKEESQIVESPVKKTDGETVMMAVNPTPTFEMEYIAFDGSGDNTEKEYAEPELTDNQRKVYEAYKEEPGMSKAEACRRTGLSYKTVSGHYNILKEMGLI